MQQEILELGSVNFFSIFITLFRYNWHAIQFTHMKYTIQCFGQQQSVLEHFHQTKEKNPFPNLAVTSLYLYHILFFHLSIENGHGLFLVFGYSVWCCCEHMCTSFCVDMYFISLRVEFLGNMVTLLLTFQGIIRLFSTVAEPFYIPVLMVIPTSSLTLTV